LAAFELPLLVEPTWLHARLDRPELRIVDASWYLPDAGRDPRTEYAEAHLPGAIFLDLSTDLADPTAPIRNTLAPLEALQHTLGRAGISSEHPVVVYDRLAGYSAGRVWWTLRYAGHENAGLLDGGLELWRSLGLPLSRDEPRHPPVEFRARPRPAWLARKADVLRAVQEGSACVVDARSAARFRGEAPEHAPRRGRIPGSRNVAWDENLAGELPRLRDRAELRALYEARGVRFDRPAIASCGSGVTASLDAFALTWLGHGDVSVYDGSWAEWAADPGLPVEMG
jgi:thiosulfate/3-mercaptopyruvate sulfurtransferase